MRFSINPNGNWKLYTGAVVPDGSTAHGTVIRDGRETGALLKLALTGRYIEYCAGASKSVDSRAVDRLLNNPTGKRGPKKQDLVTINVRLAKSQYEYVAKKSAEWGMSLAGAVRQCVNNSALFETEIVAAKAGKK